MNDTEQLIEAIKEYKSKGGLNHGAFSADLRKGKFVVDFTENEKMFILISKASLSAPEDCASLYDLDAKDDSVLKEFAHIARKCRQEDDMLFMSINVL